MTHHLYIIRHAQTHSSQYYNSDKERELKPEGIAEATQLGKFLKANNYNADLIISSHAERAKATSRQVAAEINYPGQRIHFAEKIYSGTMNDLLSLIQQTPDSIEHLLLVGHYPTIVELNNYLSDSQKMSMETCELTLLNFNSGWSGILEGSGEHILSYHPSYLI
jgi:phosphohistidine phosphatase